MSQKLRVLVLMGGRSSEHEVSLASGKKVISSLNSEKFEVFPLLISKDGKGFEKIFAIKPDVVFIAMHGPFGEDGTVQGMLEMIGIPYTGAGVLASAIGMNKPIFRKIIQAEGIAVPKFLALTRESDISEIKGKFQFPVVVKPSSQGSSIGVSIVHQEEELGRALEKSWELGPQAVVEEYLRGTEVTCGVLGNEDPIALPVVEIVPKNEFFDYEAKYTDGKCDEIVPARIAPKLTKEIQDVAIKVYKAVGCQGFGRVDMIICGGKPYVLEINTIPGLTPVSLLPKEAAAAGISYEQLLDRIIELSLEKKS
jgi:D-alanine-D-alanine ligase